MTIRTLDDVDLAGQTVGIRIDVNSPLVSPTELADDARLQAHRETLAELLDRDARVAVLAHQGRPGGDEFASLEPHAERFDELLDAPVDFLDVTFGAGARKAIADLDDGEAIVLENTRFYSEEYMEFAPERAAETYLVERLAPALDCFVNDAFAAAHRSQPSMVGFPKRLPSYAGRVMETELDVLGNIEATPTPRLYVVGGAKVPDSVDVAESVLERGLADGVLTTGVVANVFLLADGADLGDASREFIEEQGYADEIERAERLLAAHGDRIHLPSDVAVKRDGERVELALEDLPAGDGEAAMDLGEGTIADYAERMADAETVILNGPAGVFEEEAFQRGTRGVFEAATQVDTSIVGGGDTAAALRTLGIEGFTHVSTGGGAALTLLTGEELPAAALLADGN